jgi:Rieske Fe-S protein
VAEALPAAEPQEPASSGRRSVLGWIIGGLSAFMATVVGVPAVGAIVSAAGDTRRESTVELGKIADYPVGQPKVAQFTLTRTDGWVRTLETRAVWVVRTGERAATVFNGRCTHLGCAYSWQTAGAGRQAHFECPCHDGVFGLDGEVVSGPPPRALDPLPARVENDMLVITYQDYRLGVPSRTPV